MKQIILDLIEILGFAFAVLDFTGISKRLERFIDDKREKLNKEVQKWNPMNWKQYGSDLFEFMALMGAIHSLRQFFKVITSKSFLLWLLVAFVMSLPVVFLYLEHGQLFLHFKNWYSDKIAVYVPFTEYAWVLWIVNFLAFEPIRLVLLLISAIYIVCMTYLIAEAYVILLHMIYRLMYVINLPPPGTVGTIGFLVATTALILKYLL